ncbi:MAG: glycosyltransferase family 2 protein [Acidobacteriales bacterium]|nr:glycosyltransferase family 2 protein [Terriglobales bacterium]
MSNSASDISVVVLNWNRKDLLRSCLESLERQRGVHFEVIVVDNGSRDGSAEMVEEVFIRPGRLRLRLIRNSVNLGFCAANNQGIAEARGGFIALLNNDAEADPEWLTTLRGAFDERPRVGMAASKILSYDDPGKIDKAGHLIYPDGQNRGRGTGEPDDGRYDRREEVLWPDGCAAMYRRAMLDEIGGFDEDFFAYGDDAELGLRGRIAGWTCLYEPKAVVRHRRGSSLGIESTRRMVLIERNRVLLAAKLFPWSLLWLNGFYYAVRLLAGLRAALAGRGDAARFAGATGKVRLAAAIVRGDWQALLLLPKILAKRRQIKRFRRLAPAEVRRLVLENCPPVRAFVE